MNHDMKPPIKVKIFLLLTVVFFPIGLIFFLHQAKTIRTLLGSALLLALFCTVIFSQENSIIEVVFYINIVVLFFLMNLYGSLLEHSIRSSKTSITLIFFTSVSVVLSHFVVIVFAFNYGLLPEKIGFDRGLIIVSEKTAFVSLLLIGSWVALMFVASILNWKSRKSQINGVRLD